MCYIVNSCLKLVLATINQELLSLSLSEEEDDELLVGLNLISPKLSQKDLLLSAGVLFSATEDVFSLHRPTTT